MEMRLRSGTPADAKECGRIVYESLRSCVVLGHFSGIV